jgi:hypothetical protein
MSRDAMWYQTPGRHIDVYGGHAWIYRVGQGGPIFIEHTHQGRWGGCYLGVPPDADQHTINMAVLRHLARKPHRGPEPPRLMGQDGAPHVHAGGGELHQGEWIKGPQE